MGKVLLYFLPWLLFQNLCLGVEELEKLMNQARSRFRNNDIKGATAGYEKVLAKYPKNPLAAMDLGTCYFLQNNLAQAQYWYQVAAKSKSVYSLPSTVYLVRVLGARGDEEKAVALLSLLREKENAMSEAVFKMYMEEVDKYKAKENAYFSKGMSLFKEGRCQEAIDQFNYAEVLMPDAYTSYMLLRCYVLLDRKLQARSQLAFIKDEELRVEAEEILSGKREAGVAKIPYKMDIGGGLEIAYGNNSNPYALAEDSGLLERDNQTDAFIYGNFDYFMGEKAQLTLAADGSFQKFSNDNSSKFVTYGVNHPINWMLRSGLVWLIIPRLEKQISGGEDYLRSTSVYSKLQKEWSYARTSLQGNYAKKASLNELLPNIAGKSYSFGGTVVFYVGNWDLSIGGDYLVEDLEDNLDVPYSSTGYSTYLRLFLPISNDFFWNTSLTKTVLTYAKDSYDFIREDSAWNITSKLQFFATRFGGPFLKISATKNTSNLDDIDYNQNYAQTLFLIGILLQF